jgi:DNA-binding protein Fis
MDNFISQKNGSPKYKILQRLASLMLEELRDIDHEMDLKLGNNFSLYDYMAECEKNIIRYALYLADNNQAMASRLLGIKPTTLNVKIKRYQISGGLSDDAFKSVFGIPAKRAAKGAVPIGSVRLKESKRHVY